MSLDFRLFLLCFCLLSWQSPDTHTLLAQEPEQEIDSTEEDPSQVDLIEVQDKMLKEKNTQEAIERGIQPQPDPQTPDLAKKNSHTRNEKNRIKRLKERAKKRKE